VRFAALSRLLDLAVEDPLILSQETLLEMGERVKDKRQSMRSVAMIGLAKVFWKHISLKVIPFHNLGEGHEPSSAGHKKSAQSSSWSLPSPDLTDRNSLSAFAECVGIDAEVWLRLSFVPALVINCWGYPDPTEKHLVIQILQEQILPK
jgi:hypothetical protein